MPWRTCAKKVHSQMNLQTDRQKCYQFLTSIKYLSLQQCCNIESEKTMGCCRMEPFNTWSACINIMKAFLLQDISCSPSRNLAISSGPSGIRKSQFLKTEKIIAVEKKNILLQKASRRSRQKTYWSHSFIFYFGFARKKKTGPSEKISPDDQ